MTESPTGLFIEDLKIGQEARLSKTIEDSDIRTFADLSGDKNPVHLDDAYAASTFFKQRIAHGILTASLVSAVIGTKLPGPGAIYLSQSIRFKAPVFVGANVTAIVSVAEIISEKKRVRLNCVCEVDGKSVIEGEAEILVPSRG